MLINERQSIMDRNAYRTISLQVGITLFASLFGYLFQGIEVCKAAFYGGMVAVVSSLSMLRKARAADKAADYRPEYALPILLSGAVTRFILVLLLFGLAFGALHLLVVPSLAVFAMAQLAYGWGLRESYKDLL